MPSKERGMGRSQLVFLEVTSHGLILLIDFNRDFDSLHSSNVKSLDFTIGPSCGYIYLCIYISMKTYTSPERKVILYNSGII